MVQKNKAKTVVKNPNRSRAAGYKAHFSGIKAIGFDFDGTLIMSEDKKAVEFENVFTEKFNISNGVAAAYNTLAGSGMNRKEKVKVLFATFLHRKPTVQELKIVENHFGQHYQNSLKTCPLFQCSNLIKELKKQVKYLFLLSLENKREVTKIAKHCGVASYFNEILGGPKSKIENLSHVLRKHKLRPDEVIYVGDAHSDVVASRKMKVKVILLGKKHIYEKLKEDLQADFVFSSLCDLPKDINHFS